MKLQEFLIKINEFPQGDLARFYDKESNTYLYYGFLSLDVTNNKIVIMIAEASFWPRPMSYLTLYQKLLRCPQDSEITFKHRKENYYTVYEP